MSNIETEIDLVKYARRLADDYQLEVVKLQKNPYASITDYMELLSRSYPLVGNLMLHMHKYERELDSIRRMTTK